MCIVSSKILAKEDFKDTVVRFIYADGLNDNVVNFLYFQDMAKALAALHPRYEPRAVDKLSDSFLSKRTARIEKAITPDKESWPERLHIT
ncbi:hypothetical protein Ancab_011201, partial [Ancistrocladus abbreviatus]